MIQASLHLWGNLDEITHEKNNLRGKFPHENFN